MNRVSLSGKLKQKNMPSKLKSIENTANTNPFAKNPFGLSFKGKVLQADIFEVSTKSSIRANILEKGKLAASAAVGSLMNIKSTALEKIEPLVRPIIDFGKNIKTHANDIAEKIQKFELTQFKIPKISKNEPNALSRQVKELTQKPVKELREMFIEAIPV